MNKQLSRLLLILLNTPGQYYNYEELAEILSVSSRSVRNYVRNLMQFMEDIKLGNAMQISEGNVTFVGSAKDINRILKEAIDTDFYLYRLSSEERSFMIILYLLLLDEYCTLSELSDKFSVSRTTAQKDMRKVKFHLDDYNIGLDPYMRKGYRLLVSEFQRRNMILNITQNGPGNALTAEGQVNIYEKFLFNEWELDQYSLLLKSILLHTEELYDLEVSDVNFEEVLLTLQIIVKRLIIGRYMEDQESRANYQNVNVYELAGHILNEFNSHFSVPVNEAEIEYLASRLYSCRFYHRAIQEGKDVRLHLALTGFLLKISEELDVPLWDNHITAKQLESHLWAIDKAHLEGRQIRNDYTEQMIEEYPQCFELICRYRSILENVLEYEYTRDDLAVILIYLIVLIEGFPNDDDLPEVIIVCHTGIGTANFLAQKLKNNFNIKILAITSNHKLNDLIDNYKYDLIISTISLEAEPETWIKVSPVLSDEDIFNLQKIFIDIRKRKHNAAELKTKSQQEGRETVQSGTIDSVLKAENILVDVCCRDWVEVIKVAAQPLYDEGFIEKRYIEAMIRSVEVNGAYFVFSEGVALVHAGPDDGVNSFGLTLMRLDPPVSFGHKLHDPVTYVICMAIKERDYRLQEIIKLMDILSNPVSIAEINQINDAESMLRYLIRKEELYEKQEF